MPLSFLAPIALWTAAVVIPALVLLYFLKLRRRQEIVPSTLLWRRAVQDLQVNAPFQKLRKNLLLLLQLLILSAGILALARPVIESTVTPQRTVVLLLDRSASMKTLEAGDKTRFELAQEQAVRTIKTLKGARDRWWSFLGNRDTAARVMVIAFAERAEVVVPFTTDLDEAIRRIRALKPCDGRTRIAEALQLAEAYMTKTTLEAAPESAAQAPGVVLFSDGAVRGGRDVVLHAGRLTLIPIGENRDNVAITSLRIQRNYQQPENIDTLLQVQNFGPQPVTTDVSLYVDGVLRTVQTVELAAARPSEGAEHGDGATPAAKQPARVGTDISSAALSFEFPLPHGAVIEARLSRNDGLLVDNESYVVAPPPRRLRVLLVTKGNFFLESALRGLTLDRLDLMSPSRYESAPAEALQSNGQSIYDVVILDKHSTKRLPVGNYVFLGAIPEGQGIEIVGSNKNDTLQWWDETHPILRSVTLDYVFASRGLVVKVPPEAQKLAEGRKGPVLFRYARAGRNFLVLTFAIEQSTWWNKISFPKFVQNVVLFMGNAAAVTGIDIARPGDPLRIPVPNGKKAATVVCPDGRRLTVSAHTGGIARFADTQRVGVYRVEPGVPDHDRFAVNLESAEESDITPRSTIEIGGTTRVEVGRAIGTATPEIWRWFVGAALLLAFVEWYIYNKRVMI